MKLLYISLLFPLFCLAQEKNSHNFTIKEIDSIASKSFSHGSFGSIFGFSNPENKQKDMFIGATFQTTYYDSPGGGKSLIRKEITNHFYKKKFLTVHYTTKYYFFYYNNEQNYHGIVKIEKSKRNGKIITQEEYSFAMNNGAILDNLPEEIKHEASFEYSFLNEY